MSEEEKSEPTKEPVPPGFFGDRKEAEARPKLRRGFAAMDREAVRAIASLGGKAAHEAGTAHQFTTEEARAAGKKGGVAPHARRGRRPRSEQVTKMSEEQLDALEASSAAEGTAG